MIQKACLRHTTLFLIRPLAFQPLTTDVLSMKAYIPILSGQIPRKLN
jgi:hypothetical protein